MQTWQEQGGAAPDAADYFPRLHEAGDQVIRVVGSDGGTSPIYSSLISAIAAAKKYVYLTTPYFAPDAQLLDAIKAASLRGVEVKLVLPGRSNVPVAFAAGRSHYQELLDSGVEIYERQHAWLHAKTAVIDGVWSTVGTANLDRRSFLFNHEINAFILGTDFAQRLEALFERDRMHSRRVVAHEWQQRPVVQRLAEWSADLFSYWW
jgi:cardiolipin synthase